MKTNHSHTAAFLVFSWMIFLSFFNNKTNQPRPHPKPIPAITKPTVTDSIPERLTYEQSHSLILVNHINEASNLPQ